MLDLSSIKEELEKFVEYKQIPKEKMWFAIECAYAAAYKKERGKIDQVIKAKCNQDTGEFQFFQEKLVLDEKDILSPDEELVDENDKRVLFNPEKHIMLANAKLVTDIAARNEILQFPLESSVEFGRIAFQAAKQTLLQQLREAEREVVLNEYKNQQGEIVTGTVQRIEKGQIYIDLGRTVATMAFNQQIRGDRFSSGDILCAYILMVDVDSKYGNFIHLSRSNPNFITKLFEREVPELKEKNIVIEKIVRDPGVRTKLAVRSIDEALDPVGALVGERGIRVLAVKSELNGEQIDIIEYLDDKLEFATEALSPAEATSIEFDSAKAMFLITATDKQIPMIIGKRGQNISLTAQLIKTPLLIINIDGEEIAKSDADGNFEILKQLELTEEERMRREAEWRVRNGEPKKENEEVDFEDSTDRKSKEEVSEEQEINEETEENTEDSVKEDKTLKKEEN